MPNLNMSNYDLELAVKIFTPEKENWERKVRKGLDKYLCTKDLLKLLAVGGIISLAVVAPPLAGFVAKEIMWEQRARFNQRLVRLKKKKLINVYNKDGDPVIEITPDGLQKALRYKFSEMEIKTPAKWDQKWRVVIFDISNDKKKQRENFRSKLKEIGFTSLNESVLIYPYECKNEIEFVRQIFDLGEEVTYLISDRFENDSYYYHWFFERG